MRLIKPNISSIFISLRMPMIHPKNHTPNGKQLQRPYKPMTNKMKNIKEKFSTNTNK
jgi:hypothetical protein